MLPKYYAVQQYDDEKWYDYINHLNLNKAVNYRGDQADEYYGIDESGYHCYDEFTKFITGTRLLTLDEFFNLLNDESMDTKESILEKISELKLTIQSLEDKVNNLNDFKGIVMKCNNTLAIIGDDTMLRYYKRNNELVLSNYGRENFTEVPRYIKTSLRELKEGDMYILISDPIEYKNVRVFKRVQDLFYNYHYLDDGMICSSTTFGNQEVYKFLTD